VNQTSMCGALICFIIARPDKRCVCIKSTPPYRRCWLCTLNAHPGTNSSTKGSLTLSHLTRHEAENLFTLTLSCRMTTYYSAN